MVSELWLILPDLLTIIVLSKIGAATASSAKSCIHLVPDTH